MSSKKVHSRTERSFQKWFVEQMVGDGYDPFGEAHWFWDLQVRYTDYPQPARMSLDRSWTWRMQMQNFCMMKKVLLMEHTGEDQDV